MMIFYYSDRRIHADIFIRSLSLFLGQEVKQFCFDTSVCPELVIIDGEGLHPQRLKKITRLYKNCPIILISNRAFKSVEISAVIAENTPVRDVAATCNLLLGKSMAKKKSGLNGAEELLLKGLSQGISNKEMAKNYNLALSTVKYHLQNLYTKIGVHNRTQAALKLNETVL